MSIKSDEKGAAEADGTEIAGSGIIEKRVAQYIAIRDKLRAMDEAFEQSKQPLIEIQNLLTGYMLQTLEKAGATSIRTKLGTCIASTRYTASLADADAFMDFVKEQQRFDLLDRRANSTACRDYVEKHGAVPPGVNLSAIRTLGIRKPTGKVK